MKKGLKLTCLALAAALSGGALLLPGCGGGKQAGFAYREREYGATYYDNTAFHAYGGREGAIPGQWDGYGIGDPFVMRWDGAYYLYASSRDGQGGVRAWKSDDLVTWARARGEGLPEGYVLSPTDTVCVGAFAPEVYYFNGTFYMYTSPAGAGHYVYTAESPEGPFERATGNFGMSIDGSVLIDDDESMYFLNAGSGGIAIRKMTDMLTVAPTSRLLDNTNIGGWTEGPYLLKREGVYYLTYTGNAVTSDGYRVGYSTAGALTNANGDLTREAFAFGAGNPLLLSTEDADFKGLGHSSTVLGPDMDGYYIAYHSLNSASGPNRSFNIDRLLFDGKTMAAGAAATGSVKPALPAFAARGADADKFDISGGRLLSKTETPETFTAEFNWLGAGRTAFAVNYKSDADYTAVEVDFEGKSIALKRGGAAVASGVLKNEFGAGALHTVRYAQRDGKASVWFDGMEKISGAAVAGGGGKIGYTEIGEAQIGYTAFSDAAFGLSDEREVKRALSATPAGAYDRGISSAAAVAGGGVALGKGDWATYHVEFPETGFYGVELSYPAEYAGGKIGVAVDGGEPVFAALPKGDTESKTYRVTAAELNVEKGIRQIRFAADKEAAGYTAFRFFKSGKAAPTFTDDLSAYMEKGADYRTLWKIGDPADGHRAAAGTRQLLYIGDGTITDFTLTVEMRLAGGLGNAGVLFRAGQAAFSPSDTYRSIVGYYVSLGGGETRVERLCYDRSERLAVAARENAAGEWAAVKIRARGGQITVWQDGEQVLSVFDAEGLAHGRLGLYTDGAECNYRNLVVEP
jgi:hypothetical protein